MWFLIAAGVVAITYILPQTRDMVKDVPWMPLAVVVNLGLISESINSIAKTMDLDTEEQWVIEVLQDPTVKPSVRRNLKGVTLVKRKKRRINESHALQKQDAEEN